MRRIAGAANMAESPHPVDCHVGGRLRARRRFLGLTQEQLGTSLGLTFQQIQKYERGANRIGSSRLFELSHLLKVPVSYFFDGADSPSLEIPGFSDRQQDGFEGDHLASKETQDLVRAYYRISEPRVRKRMLDLMKSMASDDAG